MLSVVTVATSNYLHRAAALMQSIAELIPEAKRIVAFTDNPQTADETSSFESVHAQSLGIKRYNHLAFALNPTALCCAVKPFLVKHAFSRGSNQVIYIDNDVLLLRRPDLLINTLDSSDLSLTPHLTESLPPSACPDEATILPFGSFNAGVFGARSTATTNLFLEWWASHCSNPKEMHEASGYDQCWLNFAPCFVPSTTIVTDRGYNVATWNLATRPLERLADGSFTAGGSPLVAFHFSGYSDQFPTQFPDPSLTTTVQPSNELAQLVGIFAERLQSAGREKYFCSEYAYSRFHDGRVITPAQRRFFQDRLWQHTPPDADPFSPDFDLGESLFFPRLYRYHTLQGRIFRRIRKFRMPNLNKP